MNCLEKRHVSRKANMQDIYYLDSFMDENDREVMNLTDRAFKSLCIGDEAIYNDSEFSPSPVSCHKPLAEEVLKKTQENTAMIVKKHEAHPLNGVKNTTWQMNKNSQMSSLFKAFVTEKNGDGTMMTNGDKSVLLNIQKELSEFSTDYQTKIVDFSKGKNHIKSSETGKKSSKDTSTPLGKTTKNKQSKSNKLRKLNSKNLFLHSELSPFQSWGNLNKLGYRLENMEIFPNNDTPKWYDSPTHKELTTSHVSESVHSKKCQSATSPSVPQHEFKLETPQYNTQTVKTAPLKLEKHLEKQNLPDINAKNLQHQALLTSTGHDQRCQSEGNPCAPWRTHRGRAKSALPASLPLMNSPALEMSKPDQDIAQQNKNVIITMEEQTSSSSTPFSILQLLTPVIPSRQGTGNSDILQTVLSPTTLDLPTLTGMDRHPSPEVKREGYKSIASSLLFNLKDNRRRVKTIYSPPKFKALESVHQSKHSSTAQVDKNVLDLPDFADSNTPSPVRPKPHISQMSPLLETADLHSSPPVEQINKGLLDDYLGLSLLQAGSKSNRSTVVKASYPSLHLYRKTIPVEFDTKPRHTLGVHESVCVTDKGSNQVQNQDHIHETGGGEQSRKHNINTPAIQVNRPDKTNTKNTLLNESGTNSTAEERQSGDIYATILKEKHPLAVLKRYLMREDNLTHSLSINQEKLNERIDQVERRSAIDNKPKPKHSFSSRQNNYIKSQRNTAVDCDEDCDFGGEEASAVGDVAKGHEEDVLSSNSESKILMEETNEQNTSEELMKAKPLSKMLQNNASTLNNDLGTSINNEVSLSMKGNTSSKKALFCFKGKMPNMTVLPPKKEKIVIDKYELAKAALEEVIAEREQRKKQALSSSDTDNVKGWQRQVAGQDSVLKGEYMQVNMTGSSQRDTSEGVTKDSRSQKGFSDFKSSSQIVQSMSDRETKHGESYVAKVKLARPCKQDGTVEHLQQAAMHKKHTERGRSGRHKQSDKDNKKPSDKVDKLEKEPVAKGLESAYEKKSSSSKPEVPPRRGRTNSQCDSIQYDKDRQEDHVGRDDFAKIEVSINRDEKKVKHTPCKKRGPVRGHVSALKEKFDRDQRESYAEKDNMKEVVNVPKVTLSTHEGEIHSQEKMGLDSDSRKNIFVCQEHEDPKLTAMENVTVKGSDTKTGNIKETEKESTDKLREPDDNINKSNDHSKSSAIKLLNDLFEKSDEVNGKTDNAFDKEIAKETPTTSESQETEKATIDNVVPIDIGEQSASSSPVNHIDQGNTDSNVLKESYFLHKIEESVSQMDLPSQNSKHDVNFEQIRQNGSMSNPNCESCNSPQSVAVSPPSDVEKGGWVRCLIESANSLTPTCQSNVSSPTIGKLGLFKVKDNTFSASPVTKTIRPILHKTLPDVKQPWSPRESLSGSERGEGDLDLFKDCIEAQSPTILSPPLPSTPIRSPSPKKTPINPSSPAVSQLTVNKEGKGQPSSLTVPTEDEWQSAVSSVSEGIESCETSVGDTVEELASNTVSIEDTEGFKATSDRSGSVCSVNEPQTESKPPAVPIKTEKAMRRAMQLTTRRIQKGEAKSKQERQGRSSEKSAKHKSERRHHSTDKVLSCTSEHSVDRSSISRSTGNLNSDTVLKTHICDKHTRQHKKQEGQSTQDLSSEKVQKIHRAEKPPSQHNNQDSHTKDTSSKRQQESYDDDTNTFKTEIQCEDKHNDQFNIGNCNNQCERLGRKCQKYLPAKLDRRAHSLDRFLADKHEHNLFNNDMNSETSQTLSTARRGPLRQNSVESTYASTATNIRQSFPITQRKVLQDLDSGHYFVVDMPVQVKTKTFFDLETGSYVQLPVQSSETSLPQAQSMEVVSAPQLVLYHGFVPLPVSSLQAQKSCVKAGSIATPAEMEVCEFKETKKHQKHSKEAEPYMEPVHEHLQKEEFDSIR